MELKADLKSKVQWHPRPCSPNIQGKGIFHDHGVNIILFSKHGLWRFNWVELFILLHPIISGIENYVCISEQLAQVFCVRVCVKEKKLDQMSDFLFRAGQKFHSMKGSIIDSTSISISRGWPQMGDDATQGKGPFTRPGMGPGWPEKAHTHMAPCLSWSPWSLSTFEFCLFSALGRTQNVPPGPTVWVWLNNYKLPAADLSFMFQNMPACVFCGHASQSSSHSCYCHWECSGSMFVLVPGFGW